MIVKLQPVRSDVTLMVVKSADRLMLNYEEFDFSRLADGDTLPVRAVASNWFMGDIERLGGVLIVKLLLPNPVNYSPAQAFPVPLRDVPDGQVVFPKPLPNENGLYDAVAQLDPDHPIRAGVIDWSQVITQGMKEAAARSAELLAAKGVLAQRNTDAALRITRIEDRIETLGYGIEAEKATEADVAEQAALLLSLSTWKGYKFDLGNVTAQATWPSAPVWPIEPPVPEIAADHEMLIGKQ